MATLQTSIQLNDGMSPALRSMNKAMNILLNTFEATQVASGRAIDTNAIQTARNELARAAVSMDKLENESRAATQAQQQLTNKLEQSAQATLEMSTFTKQIETGFHKVVTAIGLVGKQLGEMCMELKSIVTNTDKISLNTKKINSNQLTLNHSITSGNQAMQKTMTSIYRANINQLRLNSGIKKGVFEANNLLRPISKIDTEINQNTAAQNKFNNSLQKGTSASGGMLSKIKSLAATYLGFQAAVATVNMADTLTNTTARLNMMNDGLQTTAELEDKIYQAAMRSRGGFAEMADAVAKLGQRAGAIFKSNDETIAFTETLNKMFVIAGASQAEMSSATLQLTQALGSGVLRGEEFNAVFEAAPNVMHAVAEYMNVPIGKLKELASEGKISASIVKNALFAAANDVNEQFASMPVTWAGVWTLIKNYTLKATRPILQVISNITSSKRFIRFASGLGQAISGVADVFMFLWNVASPVLGFIFDMAAGIASFITNNWSMIAPIVYGIAAAFLVMKAPLMAMAVWTGICTVATKAWTAAQTVFNAVMSANPITQIVLAVIALVVLFYLAVAAVNKFCGTSISATGLIAGAFGYLWATVYNVFAYMWNIVSAWVEFFANVFDHPMYSVKLLFVNLGLAVVGIMKASAGAIDAVANSIVSAVEWAVNKCIDLINDMINLMPSKAKEFLGVSNIKHVSMGEVSFTNTVSGWEDKLNAMKGVAPEGYKSMKKLEYKDVAGEVQAWYDKGKKIDESLGLSFDKDSLNKQTEDIANALSKQLEENPALKNIANGVDDIAENTGKSKEELDWMKQLAEREAINRFTLRDVSVKMTNNNQIRNGVDADEVMRKLARQIFEEADASAAGAHY